MVTICTYNARTLESETSIEDLLMQARMIRYDVTHSTPFMTPVKNCSSQHATIEDSDEEEFEALYMDYEKFCKEDGTLSRPIIGDFNVRIEPRSTSEESYFGTYRLVMKRARANNKCEANSVGTGIHEMNENEGLNMGSISDEDLAVWRDLRVEIVGIVRFICCINIRHGNGESIDNAIKFLWRPAEADIQMLRRAYFSLSWLRALAETIVNFAAHPRFAVTSSEPELQELFCHLRPICVDFKLASDKAFFLAEVARIIVKASLDFEYLNDTRLMEYPFVEPIKALSVDGDMDQMMSHMLYFAGMLRPRESTLQSLPRPFALLVEKIAQCAPGTFFFENIRVIVPFLEYDFRYHCVKLSAAEGELVGLDLEIRTEEVYYFHTFIEFDLFKKDRYALEELLFLAFSRNKFPFELVNHLIKTIGEVPSSSSFCQFPAMVVMSLFARFLGVVFNELSALVS
uniref:RPAP1_C domain-containing protein n=1 Tax=Angiostrongylus cantonensis TaxID=6313 RepID=A0A0K0DI33_ANGCA